MRARLILCLALTACSTSPTPLDASNTDTPQATDAPLDASADLGADATFDAAQDAAPDATGDVSDATNDAADAASDADDVVIVMGCPSLTTPVARPGDAPMGDTFAAYMQPFFTTWCVRCHSVHRITAVERSGAPDGYNWDDEASVRMHLPQIRNAVGVENYMPLTDPKPSCAERRRVVRWVDLGAP